MSISFTFEWVLDDLEDFSDSAIEGLIGQTATIRFDASETTGTITAARRTGVGRAEVTLVRE